MTDQEIRIEIAECCGWKWVGMHGSKKHGYWYLNLKQENMPIAESGKFGGATPSYSLPNYPEDLNAMHEACQTLGYDQSAQFVNELVRVIMGTGEKPSEEYLKSPLSSIRMAVNATAHQRAEAFLRTVGKWKD